MASSSPFTTLRKVLEGTTAVFSGTFTNERGETIPGTGLVSLTLTLFVRDETYTIINSRDEQDVLGTASPVNGGQVDEEGLLTLRLDPEDNVISDQSSTSEDHGLLLVWTWYDGGVLKTGAAEYTLPITNLETVGG